MKAKKSLGQNFLKSKAIVNTIVETADISEKDVVLEIGPGKGVLTEKLLEKAGHLVVIEKDDRLIDFLNEKFAENVKTGKLKIIHGDVLDFKPEEYFKTDYKLVANIPYYITGQIIKEFLSSEKQPSKMVLMVQKEVAKRICDKEGSILSMSVKVYGEPKYVTKVPAKYFSPEPKVDSAVLLIDKISKNFFKRDGEVGEPEFFEFMKAGFSHKRKTLINNLQTDYFGKEIAKSEIETMLAKASLSLNTRAQNLSPEDWKRLYKLCVS